MLLGSYSLGSISLASLRIKKKRIKEKKILLAGDVNKITPRGEVSGDKKDN